MSQTDKVVIQFRKKIPFIPWDELEELILINSHIWRPIRGHCFETWFDKLIRHLGYETEKVGGDDVVDRILNKNTLQLKTPYNNGTVTNSHVAYAMHKTHGLEKRPFNLYKPNQFADFLVGLHPTGDLIICPRNKLKLNKDYPNRKFPEYLADPVVFEWDSEWINRLDLLGIKYDGKSLPELKKDKNIFFPKIGEITKLSDLEILFTLLQPENFRVLEQNLKGAVRQWFFFWEAKRRKIDLTEPNLESLIRERSKVDYYTRDNKRIQVKGRTASLSSELRIGVEVKGSHGRIPQRLYKRNDFDFLGVVLDPNTISKKVKNIDSSQYNVIIFKSSDLNLHSRSTEWGGEYLKDIHYFDPLKVTFNNFEVLTK